MFYQCPSCKSRSTFWRKFEGFIVMNNKGEAEEWNITDKKDVLSCKRCGFVGPIEQFYDTERMSETAERINKEREK